MGRPRKDSAILTAPKSDRFQALGRAHLGRIAERYRLDPELVETTRLLSLVLPFRANAYVLDELIDWSKVPDDPIFQLVFPQHGMLTEEHENALRTAAPVGQRATPELQALVREIRLSLNPHPAGQLELNVPRDEDGDVVPGLQHKYRETVLYFPSNGQTCHAYCSYCFRWPQFVGDADLKFATPGPEGLVAYLRAHPAVTDVLVTGGDPLIMTTDQLRRHIEPLLAVESVRTIRLGTKSVAYWPQRFVTDADADELLRLFEQVVAAGKTLAVMSHYSHPVELSPPIARTAVHRILASGAVMYCQAPLMGHVNARGETWAALWKDQLSLGMVPYYLFIARDTGGRDYFKVPLVEAYRIYRDAYRTLPGLARTVRGPVMSATPGKVAVDGIVDLGDERVLALRMLNARDPELIGQPFFARYSDTAAWLDELEPHPLTPPAIAEAAWGRVLAGAAQ